MKNKAQQAFFYVLIYLIVSNNTNLNKIAQRLIRDSSNKFNTPSEEQITEFINSQLKEN